MAKAKITSPTPGFQPITIALTFETAEELRSFAFLMSLECTIPEFLVERTHMAEELRPALNNVMVAVQRTIK